MTGQSLINPRNCAYCRIDEGAFTHTKYTVCDLTNRRCYDAVGCDDFESVVYVDLPDFNDFPLFGISEPCDSSEAHVADEVTYPAHYAGDGRISAKDALRSMMSAADEILIPYAGFWWGMAFKYLWRWPLKNGVQDIDKCIEALKNLRKVVYRGTEDI